MHKFRSLLTRHLNLDFFRWWKNTATMKRLVSGFDVSPSENGTYPRAAVVIIPWQATDVPWFSTAIGLLWQRKRRDVDYIVDDLPFGNKPLLSSFILMCIKKVTDVLQSKSKVISLRRYQSQDMLSSQQQMTVDKLCKLNAIWLLKGESKIDGRREYETLIRRQLQAAYATIEALLSDCRYDCIFVPGGVYATSGIWVHCAQLRGIRVASFDSGGKGLITFAASGIAAQLHDIPRAVTMVKERPNFSQELACIKKLAIEEIQRRQAGKDRFAYQVTPHGQSLAGDGENILIALNSSWDSAALGLHVVFENTTQWLLETVRWILSNTHSSVIVRQHPVERMAVGRSNDDYRNMLYQCFGDEERICFIAAADPVNSYELMKMVDAVIVYTSTIGVEATITGKPVITPSKSYYSNLGFVWNAQTQEEYFDHIKSATNKSYIVDEQRKQDAMLCYYITQCCNWIPTPLSPEGFEEWSRLDLDQLYQNEAVQLTVRALDENIPVSYLQHEKQIQQYL